jgi:hypothetical protein
MSADDLLVRMEIVGLLPGAQTRTGRTLSREIDRAFVKTLEAPRAPSKALISD